MSKELLLLALVAVIAVDKISFDNVLYEPGSTVDGLTPEQADGLVANGHAKHVKADAAEPAEPATPPAPADALQAANVATAAATATAAAPKAAAAKAAKK